MKTYNKKKQMKLILWLIAFIIFMALMLGYSDARIDKNNKKSSSLTK